MFDIARDALLTLAGFNHGYGRVSHSPVKFCHGYGIFQYDIQFFKDENPDFFLQKKWFSFDECLALALKELTKRTTFIHVLEQENLTFSIPPGRRQKEKKGR